MKVTTEIKVTHYDEDNGIFLSVTTIPENAKQVEILLKEVAITVIDQFFAKKKENDSIPF